MPATTSDHDVIRKSPEAWRVTPNLLDYEEARRTFSWQEARRALDGLPDGRGLNIAHEAVDRHARGARAGTRALRWLGRDGAVKNFSYADLSALSSRFANVLRELGVGAGDVVFALTGRLPALYATALGTLKNRSVFSPLFAAFGPEPIRARMAKGRARVLVTTGSMYRKKLAGIRRELPDLEYVLVIGEEGEPPGIEDVLDFHRLMHAADDTFEIPPTDPEDPALLHFTSGTTGTPKGALHVHEAVVAHHVTGELALDLHPEDVYWCTADPGWVTGTSYGIISPLTNGVRMVVDEADMDVERWYRILEDQEVTVWYTAPTAIRMLMRAGQDVAREHDFPHLRFIASVGEPLNPEAVVWGQETFGLPIHDNWWQTETGGIMIANFASQEVRPGSMGRPLPGVEAAVVRRQERDEENGGERDAEEGGEPDVEVIETPGEQGELALEKGWPSMFRAYVEQEERYRRCFSGDWYLTGDLVRRDPDGFFWFVARADDVIKSSGHLIGPFEVESVLMEHDAVAEAAVIGKPDPVAGEVVKAFVSPAPGQEAGEALRSELRGHARKRLGAAVAPKEIEFVESIPKTRSGKIMRRLLRSRELGEPAGDTSTLERQ